jgi:phosphomannomutase
MDFGDWRFNLRPSNTEPLLRMNMETRGDYRLMEQKRDELLRLIGA